MSQSALNCFILLQNAKNVVLLFYRELFDKALDTLQRLKEWMLH